MNIVITGGTSFIGLALIRRLILDGNHIFAVVRPSSANRGKLPVSDLVHLVESDLNQLDDVNRVTGFSKMDVFVHLGWDGVGSAGRCDAGIQKYNIDNSIKAVRLAARLGCSRFLFAGSQAEYGIRRGRITEETPCNPVSEYGKAKLKFGNQAKILCKSLNLEYIHSRIFSVYGPGDHPWSLVNTCIRTFSDGGHMTLGECTQQWNFLYIDDMAEAMARLITCHAENISGIYNIAGHDTRVLREFVEEMHRLCGGKGSYSYGEREPNAEGPASLNPDIGKIEAVTGWKPSVTFSMGIERTRAGLLG